MSGPSLDQQICYDSGDDFADYFHVRKLRELADYVEDQARPTREDEPDFENREHVAELLRLKADKIESALQVIENETQMNGFQKLLKNIQWTRAGDYGSKSIQKAWENYADEVVIRVEK